MPVEIKGRFDYPVEIHIPNNFSHITKKFQSKETEMIIRPALAEYFPVSSLYYYEVKNSIPNKNLSTDYICVEINSVISYDDFEKIKNLLQDGKYYINHENRKALEINVEHITQSILKKYEISIKPEIKNIIQQIKNIDPNYDENDLIYNHNYLNKNFFDLILLPDNDKRKFKDFKYGFEEKNEIIVDKNNMILHLAFLLSDYFVNKEIFDKVFDLLN
jgi:hypothetical protein